MKVLFVGDVVGPAAAAYLAGRLPGLRRKHAVDLAVVNAENCAPTGVGLGAGQVSLLLGSGADVITSGNHAWDAPDFEEVLEHPRVLRPLNVPDGVPGRGALPLEVGGETASVVVLADDAALALAEATVPEALPAYEAWLSADLPGTTVVDFHAQSVMDKQAFAFAADGRVAAVLGTHTHEPTLPLHVLPGGTALVTEVGMTGAYGGPQGFDPRRFVARTLGMDPVGLPPVAPAAGPIALGAVLLVIKGGRTLKVERLL